MPKQKKPSNRHPVDRLFDLRETIKNLQAEADMLKSDIMRTGDYVGSEFMAVPKSATQQRLDRDKLNMAFGKAAVDACTKPVEVVTLNIFKKADVHAPKGLLDD